MNIGQILRLKFPLKSRLRLWWQTLTRQFRGDRLLLHPKFPWIVLPFGLLPPLFVLLFAQSLSRHAKQIDRQLCFLEKKARFVMLAQQQREQFTYEFGGSDPHYLDKYVESIALLKRDTEILEKILQNQDYAAFPAIEQRYHFLTGGDNRMQFSSLWENKSEFFFDKLWRLDHPVEANCDDIRNILSLLEGVKIDHFLPNPVRPQLFFTSFSLVKKDLGEASKVFTIDMEVYQRGCNGSLQ